MATMHPENTQADMPEHREQHAEQMPADITNAARDAKSDIEKVLKTAQMIEIDPREVPFKKGMCMGFWKMDKKTGTLSDTFATGILQNDITIGECAYLDEGISFHTSPITACFRDARGDFYVRTNNSIYMLHPFSIDEEESSIDAPTEEEPRALDISGIVERNAKKRTHSSTNE